jgi:hypothetical protein
MHTYDPPILDYTDSTIPVEERCAAIKSMLHDYECMITFTKVNGDIREMHCTLREDAMPVASSVIKEDVADIPNNVNHITVWCIDKENWRAMRTMSITKVMLAPKRWLVELDEDPETGDLILPFPEEMLAQVGWKEGDTLSWNDNGNGSWSISKKIKDE